MIGGFRHALNDLVKLTMSGEKGQVIGRAEYTAAENAYLVRYVTADGRQVEQWLGQSAIDDAESLPE